MNIYGERDKEKVAAEFAQALGEKLVLRFGTRATELGKGSFGAVYGLEGDKGPNIGKALKIQMDDKGANSVMEAIIGFNLPKTPSLAYVLKYCETNDVRDKWVGQVMPLVGVETTELGLSKPYATLEQGLVLAADLAVALYAMHTKITGYTMMHLDLAPKNVGVRYDEKEQPHAVLFDFGLSLTRKLTEKYNPKMVITTKPKELPPYTRKRWESWKHNGFGTRPDLPFQVNVEYRQAANIVLRATGMKSNGERATGRENSFIYKALYKYEGSGCDRECSAKKVMSAWETKERKTNPSGAAAKLYELLTFWMFDHAGITDEREQVLGHPSFSGMVPSPVEVADSIQMVNVTDDFVEIIGKFGGPLAGVTL